MSRTKLIKAPRDKRGEKCANFLSTNASDLCNNRYWNVFMSINSALQGRTKPGEKTCMTGMLKSPITCLGRDEWTKREVLLYVKNNIVYSNHCQLRSKHLMNPYKPVS